MHPPLNIIDQTDELIAIEWLRENGYSTYAEHMEASLELPFYSRHFIRYTPQSNMYFMSGISFSESMEGESSRSIGQSVPSWYAFSESRSREVRRRFSSSNCRYRFDVGLSTQGSREAEHTVSVSFSRRSDLEN